MNPITIDTPIGRLTLSAERSEKELPYLSDLMDLPTRKRKNTDTVVDGPLRINAVVMAHLTNSTKTSAEAFDVDPSAVSQWMSVAKNGLPKCRSQDDQDRRVRELLAENETLRRQNTSMHDLLTDTVQKIYGYLTTEG